jgi:glyoxylase-like metal-dependent hydrolase (beta-lactamase superfamily II)
VRAGDRQEIVVLALGDVTVTRVEEVILHEATSLFAEWTDDMLQRHEDVLLPHCFDTANNAFFVSIHSYLVKTPKQTILIDTCGGNDKPRPASPRFDRLNTPWLERLKTAGASPEQIDTVICTHLHIDHVGWNTRLENGKWVPTFPAARYVFPRAEVEARDPKRGAANKPEAMNLPFVDSVLPILEAGRATLVEGDERWSDEIDFMPTPGHAPGQMAVRLRAGGEEVIFIADVMHQPVQIYHPTWNAKYCENQELAPRTRRRMLDYCADHGSLVLPAHFCFPHGGHIRRNGDGFVYAPSARNVNPT